MPRGFLIGCVLGLFLGGGLALLLGVNPIAPAVDALPPEDAALSSGSIAPQPVEIVIDPADDLRQPEGRIDPKREELAADQRFASPTAADLPDSWLAGQVVDGVGKGIANAIVRAEMVTDGNSKGRDQDKSFAPLSAAARTSATGRFVLRGLLAGMEYRIGARMQGRTEMSLGGSRNRSSLDTKAFTPRDDLVLSLSESGLLVVLNLSPEVSNMLDDDDQLRLEVQVTSENGGSSSSSGSFPLEFKVTVAAESKISLSIRGQGLRDVLFRDLILTKDEGMRRLEVDLEVALGVSVVVLQLSDDRGNVMDVADIITVRYEAQRDVFMQNQFRFREPLRGVNGRFEVSNLMHGEQTLRIDGPEGLDLVPAFVDISVPEVGEVFRQVVLQHGGRLSLRLAGNQSPISIDRMELRVHGDWRHFRARLRRPGSSSRLTIRKLESEEIYELPIVFPPGTYGLRLHRPAADPIELEFTIIAGQVTSVAVSGA